MQQFDASALQRQTLRLYGELLAEQAYWPGALVFASGDGVTATGLPAAVSIAGGTTLALDPNAAIVKAVFRQGGVDFVVNTLDEALRVLKNEIRKKKPLSVALLAEVQPVLSEMADRGVLPDLLVDLDGQIETPEFAEAKRLRVGATQSDRLAAWLAERGWSEAALAAGSTAELRELDARLLGILPNEDTIRRAWAQRIGHYQRATSEGARALWLTDAERATLGLAGF